MAGMEKACLALIDKKTPEITGGSPRVAFGLSQRSESLFVGDRSTMRS